MQHLPSIYPWEPIPHCSHLLQVLSSLLISWTTRTCGRSWSTTASRGCSTTAPCSAPWERPTCPWPGLSTSLVCAASWALKLAHRRFGRGDIRERFFPQHWKSSPGNGGIAKAATAPGGFGQHSYWWDCCRARMILMGVSQLRVFCNSHNGLRKQKYSDEFCCFGFFFYQVYTMFWILQQSIIWGSLFQAPLEPLDPPLLEIQLLISAFRDQGQSMESPRSTLSSWERWDFFILFIS